MPTKKYTLKNFEVICKDGEMYYSEDGGKTRYECYLRSAYSNAVDVPQLGIEDITVEFGGTRRLRSMDDNKDNLTETIFVSEVGHLELVPFSEESETIAFVPLPDDRKITMTVKLPDNRLFLVDEPKYRNNRLDRRAFIHDGDSFVQHSMSPMMVARDGGSVRFDVGTNQFFKPSPWQGPNAPCTWNDVHCTNSHFRVMWGPGPDYTPVLSAP